MLRVFAIKSLNSTCEIGGSHTLGKLALKFLAGLIKIFLVSFLGDQILAQLRCDFSILVHRLEHHLNLVPKPILILFQVFVSLKQFSIKRVRQFAQLIFESSNFAKHFLVGYLLFLPRFIHVFLFQSLTLFHLFFQLVDLCEYFFFHLTKLTFKTC